MLLTMVLLFLFQALWVKITQRITTELTPMFQTVARLQNLPVTFFQEELLRGPGKVLQTILGGEDTRLDNPQDLLIAGYLYPFVQVILAIWAIGRAGGAIAGELDRGTMELLLSLPISRSKLILTHILVDLCVIPLLCLAIWAGSLTGCWLVGTFEIDPATWARLRMPPPENPVIYAVSAWKLFPALANVAGLLLAISSITLAFSAFGRSRNRTLGLVILFFLIQFLVNVIGQFWQDVAWLRPGTIFFFYQPQRIVSFGQWWIDLGSVWNSGQPMFSLPMVGVLIGVSIGAYTIAWLGFRNRDLPAPL
ncbi:ABC transporter permease subunit [Tuwongella immobilis]|uniref:ABC transporter permease subunit n=1 Tax=Tuwongella immobilis TaxID=692036 RepID=UPI001E4D5E13|nr:ABC transporter permease subunit [Tuwongella immobilis]